MKSFTKMRMRLILQELISRSMFKVRSLLNRNNYWPSLTSKMTLSIESSTLKNFQGSKTDTSLGSMIFLKDLEEENWLFWQVKQVLVRQPSWVNTHLDSWKLMCLLFGVHLKSRMKSWVQPCSINLQRLIWLRKLKVLNMWSMSLISYL